MRQKGGTTLSGAFIDGKLSSIGVYSKGFYNIIRAKDIKNVDIKALIKNGGWVG